VPSALGLGLYKNTHSLEGSYSTLKIVSWICLEEQNCEAQPIDSLSPWDSNNSLKIPWKIEDEDGDPIQDPIRGWYALVNEYSRRKITFETDRLLAVSGLAKEFSEISKTRFDQNPTYHAGIWEGDFCRGLVWRAPCPEVPGQHHISPHHGLGLRLRWETLTKAVTTLGYTEIHEEDDAQLLYIGVESFNDDPFSKVNSGFICIRARGQEITQLDDYIVIFDDPQDERDFKDFISISHG
jgi:hypothetical protein